MHTDRRSSTEKGYPMTNSWLFSDGLPFVLIAICTGIVGTWVWTRRKR